MRLFASLCTVLCAAVVAAAAASEDIRTVSIYVQPVVTTSSSSAASASPASPSLLAEIQYDVSSDPLAAAAVSSYEAPDIPKEGAELVRIGIFDPRTQAWASSTSVTAAANFGKGFSPHLVLSVDAAGNYLGVSVRGVAIDAGATRDFGPQARVLVSRPGKQVEPNRPVVLSPEGRKVAPEEEKTFLQKYDCHCSLRAPCAVFLVSSSLLRVWKRVLTAFAGTGGLSVSQCSCWFRAALGEIRNKGKKKRKEKKKPSFLEFVYDLPSASMCLEVLSRLCERSV